MNTFGELMGQLNDTANIGLSCKDDDIGEVEIFEAFGTPGMALESRLKVRALNKLTYYNDYLQYLQDNITAVGIIVFDCHVDTYFFRINARSHMIPSYGHQSPPSSE